MPPAVKRCAVIWMALFILSPQPGHSVERSETERLTERMAPPISVFRPVVKKEEVTLGAYYEPSEVLQGSRTGRWIEWTNQFGYTRDNINSYILLSQFERFDNRDRAANIGTYLNFGGSYAHIEFGWGWDIDYIYKFQSITEYGRRLYSDLFWQIGYSYRAYDTDDVHLIYPGLLYYFGNSYISADYGTNYTEARDTAHFGAIRGSFAITSFLRWQAGVTFGEKLYDINELDARNEFGCVVYTALIVTIHKSLSVRAGCSYGQEEPKFIKRSIDFGVSIRF